MKKKIRWMDCQCGDCEYNMGHDGRNCHCEKTGGVIYPDDPACSAFNLWCDLEEEYELVN